MIVYVAHSYNIVISYNVLHIIVNEVQCNIAGLQLPVASSAEDDKCNDLIFYSTI